MNSPVDPTDTVVGQGTLTLPRGMTQDQARELAEQADREWENK